jgi:hypothetical protein
MQRLQVQLTDEQIRNLKWLARQKGVSMSEILRRGADEMLRTNAPTRDELWERAMSVVGCAKGDGSPVARNHDDYLDEIYGS